MAPVEQCLGQGKPFFTGGDLAGGLGFAQLFEQRADLSAGGQLKMVHQQMAVDQGGAHLCQPICGQPVGDEIGDVAHVGTPCGGGESG